MKTVTVEQARNLAYAYADYSSIRPSELNTGADISLAIAYSWRLRRAQDKSGIRMIDKIDGRIEKLKWMYASA